MGIAISGGLSANHKFVKIEISSFFLHQKRDTVASNEEEERSQKYWELNLLKNDTTNKNNEKRTRKSERFLSLFWVSYVQSSGN